MTGERILLVDDGADLRQFLARTVLEPAGYDVLTAADGEEGFVLARDLQPDVVISDYLMPKRTGLQMLEDLRHAGVNLPFILMTAEGSEELAVRALRLGVNDYLIKPFDPERLLDVVQRVLADYWNRQITEHIPAHLLEANRQLEQRLRELDTLVAIGKRVTAMLDLQGVLNHVVDASVQLAGAERGSLLLVDEPTGELYLYAATGPDARPDDSFRVPVADSLIGRVVQTGEPLVLTGDELLKIKTDYLAHDLAYVPLTLQERVIGVLGVANHEESREFESFSIQLLTVLADFAAIAIDNARLYAGTKHERDTLDAILRNTDDVIIVADRQDRVMFCNPAACRTFGLGLGELVGRALPQVLEHKQVLELFQKPDTRRGRSFSGEIALDGGKRVLNAHLTLVEGVGKVVVMQDITHLKELDRIKSDFVTTVSHDLRSPLTSILGYLELLSRSGSLNKSQQEYADRIVGSVKSITGLITDLLELGKIEAGFDQEREPTALDMVVFTAIENLRPQWESKSLRVRAHAGPELPMVRGNPLRLRQLVNNLIENAVKYTPEDGRITVSLEADDDVLVLRVADTGIGIPAKDQPHVFEKFYRTDEAIDHYVGTGLGLSIVKGIVDQHQGRIWVESQEGRGTTFTVMLPAIASGDADRGRRPS